MIARYLDWRFLPDRLGRFHRCRRRLSRTVLVLTAFVDGFAETVFIPIGIVTFVSLVAGGN